MTFRLRNFLGVFAIAGWLMSGTALAENRLALVVGNSAYQAVPALPNPANDARAMTAFLTSAGFDVTTAPDLTQADMRRAVSDFAAKVSRAGSDTVALVYYAGHGVQVDGENFLVPVDASVQRESDVPLQMFRLNDIMNTLSSVPSRMKIVMLDACRNNPFSEINKTTGRGLAIVDAPAGSIVSYSTSPGAEAEDGTGENSPYTSALLAVAKEPGLPIEQAFKRTRLSVHQTTSGRQTPWESSSLASDFAFFPGKSGEKPIPVSAQAPQALAVTKSTDTWKRELRSLGAQRAYDVVILEDKAEAYEAYIALYGTPPFGPRVRGLLDRRNEMVAWYIAVTINNPAAIQNFLNKYPSSDLAVTAMRLLERANSRSLMANANIAPAQVASLAPTCACQKQPARTQRASAPPPPPPVYNPPPRVRVVATPVYVRPAPIIVRPGPIVRPGGPSYPPPRGDYPPMRTGPIKMMR